MVGWREAHYIALMPHNPLGPISTAANINTIYWPAATAAPAAPPT